MTAATGPELVADLDASSTCPSENADARWGRPVRLVLAVVYGAILVRQSLGGGLPFDRWRLLAWIVTALAVSCVGRPWRRSLRLVLDWSPFLAVVLLYSYSRGVADTLGMPIQSRSVLHLEQALFHGHVPSVWLQSHLLPDGPRTPVGLWEVAVTLVYTSHFVVPYVLAGYLWLRDRTAWLTYVVRFAILSVAAVATFAVIPTAPPWLAASSGLIDEVTRPVGRGWERISFHAASVWLDVGRGWVNPVAAIPSLHTAYAGLVAVTLWTRVRAPITRSLLVAYPVAMGFVLVYGAEHYVVDVLAGGLYLLFAVVVERSVMQWRSRRRAVRERPPEVPAGRSSPEPTTHPDRMDGRAP